MPYGILITLVVLALGLLAAVLMLLLRRPTQPPADPAALSLLQNQVNATVQQTAQQLDLLRNTVTESLQSLAGQVSTSLGDAHRTLGDRLDNTTRVVSAVHQQLGQLGESSRRMVELGENISKLQDILQPPKLRGSLGELFLKDLLDQVLPPSHFRLQYRFQGGDIVDAAILLHAGIVPVDAKFPLENFRRVLSAGTDEERRTARKTFVRDVKTHIDAIASKYIRPDEKTFDFALMYIPAENVYYETILKYADPAEDPSLITYALRKRVIPVSPNSFYVYLQTIILGLRGLRVEERSREILDTFTRLHREVDLFDESFRVLGQHLENALKKYGEAQKRFDKVTGKMGEIDGLAKGLNSPEGGTPSDPPPPAPAAG